MFAALCLIIVAGAGVALAVVLIADREGDESVEPPLVADAGSGSSEDSSDEDSAEASEADPGSPTDDEILGIAPDGFTPEGHEDFRYGTALVRLDGGPDALIDEFGPHDREEPDELYEEDTWYVWDLAGGSELRVLLIDEKAIGIEVVVPPGGAPVALAEGVAVGTSTWSDVEQAWGPADEGTSYVGCSGEYRIGTSFDGSNQDNESGNLGPSDTPRYMFIGYADEGPGQSGCPDSEDPGSTDRSTDEPLQPFGDCRVNEPNFPAEPALGFERWRQGARCALEAWWSGRQDLIDHFIAPEAQRVLEQGPTPPSTTVVGECSGNTAFDCLLSDGRGNEIFSFGFTHEETAEGVPILRGLSFPLTTCSHVPRAGGSLAWCWS